MSTQEIKVMYGITRNVCSGLAVTALLMLSNIAVAADAAGNYVVRGMGAHTCADYMASVPSNPDYTQASLLWIEGYLTAHNRLAQETFDVSFLSETSEVAALLLSVCASNSNTRVEVVLAELLWALAPLRIEASSALIAFQEAGVTVMLRQSTLMRLQSLLKQKGYYKMAVDGLSGPGTVKALRRYQAAEGLNTSGVPDADTLIRLFMSRGE